MPGHLGVHIGEMVITIEAMPTPDDPEKVQQINPSFGGRPKETPERMEEVARGQIGTKNLNPFPRYRSYDDTRMGVIAHPHPTLSYFEVSDPTKITPEAVASATPVPNLLPPDSPIAYHLGGNYADEVSPGMVKF